MRVGKGWAKPARRAKSKKRAHILLTADEAEMVLELWATQKFSTWDIARFVRVHEAAVDRLIHAAKGVAIEMLRARP